MKKNDFISVIGYHGNLALVDKKLKRHSSGKTIGQLIKEGQFKAAFCQSFIAGDEKEKSLVAAAYNQLSSANYTGKELEKLFGVFSVPEKVKIQEI